MKKLAILIVFGILLSDAVSAQQLARRTQYLFNPYMLNPAVAGTTPYSPITAAYRNQWSGFDGAPSTYMLSGHTRIPNINLGVGAIAFHDNTGGAIARTGAEITGAYSINLNNRDAVSFGLSGVFSQFRFDSRELVFRDLDDPVLVNGLETAFNFDATFGMMVYGDNYFFGFSIPQLLQTKLGVVGVMEDMNQNVRHFNFMGSYLYEFNSTWAYQPTALLRFTEASPVQFDILNKFVYRKFLWAGLTYRHLDAVAFAFGVEHLDFAFAYSYDITTTGARALSPHTHEVTLSYLIPRQGQVRKKSARKPNIKRRRVR